MGSLKSISHESVICLSLAEDTCNALILEGCVVASSLTTLERRLVKHNDATDQLSETFFDLITQLRLVIENAVCLKQAIQSLQDSIVEISE